MEQILVFFPLNEQNIFIQNWKLSGFSIVSRLELHFEVFRRSLCSKGLLQYLENPLGYFLVFPKVRILRSFPQSCKHAEQRLTVAVSPRTRTKKKSGNLRPRAVCMNALVAGVMSGWSHWRILLRVASCVLVWLTVVGDVLEASLFF